MKAVRLYKYGGPEELIFEDNVPDPVLGDDTVLIEAAATSVNPYKEFLNLWKDADPDIPIYKAAKAEYAKLQ